jgi:DNA-binding GntR family transcriptional regulator
MKTKGAASAAVSAYRELRRRILANELPAGTQMLEVEVADELGISRTPAREALIRLAEDGLVEVRPRHGMRVLPVSARDMREIYQILTELESLAARLVAERGLTPEQLAELDTAVLAMDGALAAKDLTAWAAADERFHGLLIDYAGNRRLQSIVSMVWDQAHRARMITLKLRPLPVRSNEDHRALLEAIRARDADRADAVHRQHRVAAGSMLVALLERLGLGQL